MDGVLCDYAERMLELASLRYGLPRYQPSEVAEFYTERIFPEEFHKTVDELSLEQEFFENLPPIEGAIEAVNEMLGDPNLSVWVCSAPKKTSPYCHSEKFRWLKKHFGQEFAERLILTRDKTLAVGDYLIDDKLVILGENQNPSWEHIVFDQPYNQGSDKKRVNWQNWKSILN